MDAMVLSLHNPVTIGKTYNLGAGELPHHQYPYQDLLVGLWQGSRQLSDLRWDPPTQGDPPRTHALIQSIANDYWVATEDQRRGRHTAHGRRLSFDGADRCQEMKEYEIRPREIFDEYLRISKADIPEVFQRDGPIR